MKRVLIALIMLLLFAVPAFASDINNEMWFGLGKASNDNSFVLGGHGEHFGMNLGGIIDNSLGLDLLYFLPGKDSFKFYIGAGLYYEGDKNDNQDNKLTFTPSVGVRFYPYVGLSIGAEYHKERGTSILLGYGY